MGRARAKKQKTEQQGDEKQADESAGQNDPARALIALHPNTDDIVIAVGKQIRIFNRSTGNTRILQENSAPVRAIAFDATGRFMASGGDDKCFYLWNASTYEVIQSWRSPKKISDVAFTNDGEAVLAADKFGDILVGRQGVEKHSELLGHFCSIITSVSLSHDGKFIATTDRDHRVRVSILPSTNHIMQGAPEIQSFCFGHTLFVTCAKFVRRAADGAELLVSGSGDGTIRLWDYQTGQLLDTLEIDGQSVVLSLEASLDGNSIVAVLDAKKQLLVNTIDWENKKFGAHSSDKFSTLDDMPLPTEIVVDKKGRFWVIGGPPTQDSTGVLLACASLNAEGQLVTVSSDDWLSKDQKTALEGLGEVDVSSIQEGQSYVAAYLHKFSFSDKKARDRKEEGEDQDEEEGNDGD